MNRNVLAATAAAALAVGAGGSAFAFRTGLVPVAPPDSAAGEVPPDASSSPEPGPTAESRTVYLDVYDLPATAGVQVPPAMAAGEVSYADEEWADDEWSEEEWSHEEASDGGREWSAEEHSDD